LTSVITLIVCVSVIVAGMKSDRSGTGAGDERNLALKHGSINVTSNELEFWMPTGVLTVSTMD